MSKLPALITIAGAEVQKSYLKFFTVRIRNKNTRLSYVRAVNEFLLFCEERSISLFHIEGIVIAAYIEQKVASDSSKNASLTALRKFFSFLVTEQILATNPASEVRFFPVKKEQNSAPILSKEQVRELLDSIDESTLIGLRDKALITLMLYSFARISAVLAMEVKDFFKDSDGYKARLYEKGGKVLQVPLHPTAKDAIERYVNAAGIKKEKRTKLFRTLRGNRKSLSSNGLQRTEVYLMIKRRVKLLDLPDIACHSLRATGITHFLDQGGSIFDAQKLAGHKSVKTTEIYDRRHSKVDISEIAQLSF